LGLGTAEKAAELFESALEIVSEKGLQWWLPTVTYYTGLVHFENGAAGKAQQYFAKAVEAVSQRGCPDYLPQALLGLAMVEADPEKKRGLLVECVRTAEERARFVDRMYCLEVAGGLLKGLD
jgi:hypothetical protein